MADFKHLQTVMREMQDDPESISAKNGETFTMELMDGDTSSGYSSMSSSKNSTLQRRSPETPERTVYHAQCNNVGCSASTVNYNGVTGA